MKATSSLVSHAGMAYMLVLMTFNFQQSSAWSLASDCTGQYAQNIKEAMPNAINIMNYAAGRANDQSKERKGNLMQDMLGAPNENDPDTLSFVNEWMTKAATMGGTYTASGLDNLLIHCADSHLALINVNQRNFRDQTPGFGSAPVQLPFPNVQSSSNTLNTACGGFLNAFAYPVDGESFKGNVIVLCSDSIFGALKTTTHNSLDSWRTTGNLKTASSIAGPGNAFTGLNIFSKYLSYVIIHEMMHCTSFAQFAGRLPDPVNGQPPRELYGYDAITGKPVGTASAAQSAPSVNNRQHNADSMALLACGWYLPLYAWVNGECKTVGKVSQPPLQYGNTPAQSTPQDRVNSNTAQSKEPPSTQKRLVSMPKKLVARGLRLLHTVTRSIW
ncbi:hypothetical protein MMC11_009049 [Xylographa trunciseda]|nr:hypothetical protein [Xylographa trunciseda]